jgi:hypothetical protein
LVGGLGTVEELASISEFVSGEVGADLHRGSALWAIPTGRRGRGRWARLLRLRGDREQLPKKRQISRPVASRQGAILPNADETTRQNVLGEAAQKLRGTQGHFALFAAMGVVFPAEGNPLAIEGQQAVIADSDAMSVPTEIAEHLSRPAESWFGIDYPVLSEDGAQKRCESLRVFQFGYRTMEAQILSPVGSPQSRDELAAEHGAEHLHRQEERIPGMDPLSVVRRKSAGWNRAVDMWMEAPTPTIP